jgi:hypothetical protein
MARKLRDFSPLPDKYRFWLLVIRIAVGFVEWLIMNHPWR